MTANVSPELLHAALVELTIASAPFRRGRGMQGSREALDKALTVSSKALKVAGVEEVPMNMNSLRKLADEADAERAAMPGYRADLN